MDLNIGWSGAVLLMTASNWQQLQKSWVTKSTGDLSIKMLLALATGQVLWIAYGVLKSDWVIIAANIVSVSLVIGILYVKLREGRNDHSF